MMNVAPPGRIESPHHLLLEPALSLRRSVVRESASGSAGSLLASAESCLERKPAHCRLTSAARILLLGTAPRCSLVFALATSLRAGYVPTAAPGSDQRADS